jgi:hypothetical protein
MARAAAIQLIPWPGRLADPVLAREVGELLEQVFLDGLATGDTVEQGPGGRPDAPARHS